MESMLARTDIRMSHHILKVEYSPIMKGRSLILSSSNLSDSSISLFISDTVLKLDSVYSRNFLDNRLVIALLKLVCKESFLLVKA